MPIAQNKIFKFNEDFDDLEKLETELTNLAKETDSVSKDRSAEIDKQIALCIVNENRLQTLLLDIKSIGTGLGTLDSAKFISSVQYIINHTPDKELLRYRLAKAKQKLLTHMQFVEAPTI